jgi:hypothetical protein
MAGTEIKGSEIWKAFVDLVILALLMVGAGFGGYWYGIHERLAPVKSVAPGTPGALPATAVTTAPGTAAATTATATTTAPATTPAATTQPADSSSAQVKKKKFFVTSSGTSFVGYNVVVNVNGTPVDSFYGPGKTLDISDSVKGGDNTVSFTANHDDKYNKHKGDSASELKIQVVTAPQMQDSYKPSDVIATFKVNAAGDDDESETFHFKGSN